MPLWLVHDHRLHREAKRRRVSVASQVDQSIVKVLAQHLLRATFEGSLSSIECHSEVTGVVRRPEAKALVNRVPHTGCERAVVRAAGHVGSLSGPRDDGFPPDTRNKLCRQPRLFPRAWQRDGGGEVPTRPVPAAGRDQTPPTSAHSARGNTLADSAKHGELWTTPPLVQGWRTGTFSARARRPAPSPRCPPGRRAGAPAMPR